MGMPLIALYDPKTWELASHELHACPCITTFPLAPESSTHAQIASF